MGLKYTYRLGQVHQPSLPTEVFDYLKKKKNQLPILRGLGLALGIY